MSKKLIKFWKTAGKRLNFKNLRENKLKFKKLS